MKKYIVRVNCDSFRDIEVEANSKEEAGDIALKQFNCPQQGAEVESISPLTLSDNK